MAGAGGAASAAASASSNHSGAWDVLAVANLP